MIWNESIILNIENNFITKNQKIPKIKEISYIEPPRLKIPDPLFLRRMRSANLKLLKNQKLEEITRTKEALAKSINCQAHALACFKILSEDNKLDLLDDRVAFLKILKDMDSDAQFSIF